MLTDGSQRRRVPVESVVSGLRLVLVCNKCPCEPPGSGCLVQKGLPSRSLAGSSCGHQGRLYTPAEDPWVLPTPPASFRVCQAGPGQVPPDMCEHLALPFWTLNIFTSCPALASGLSPAGAEAVPPGSCHPQNKRAPGLRCKVDR